MLLLLGNSNAEAIGAQKTIHMPIAMTIADEAMIIRSIVSHDGICVEGCSSIAPSLYPGHIIAPGSTEEREIDHTRGYYLRHRRVSKIITREELLPTRHRQQ